MSKKAKYYSEETEELFNHRKVTRFKEKYIAYYRVSTKAQSKKHGLDSQQSEVMTWLNGGKWELVAEYQDIESGKNNSNREGLIDALEACKESGATLIVARLDRLSRDLEFIARLQKSEVKFVCLDMPEANEVTIGIMAVLAQAERKRISKNVKAGLKEAKKKGVKLGASNPKIKKALKGSNNGRSEKALKFATSIYNVYLVDFINDGLSQRTMVERLNKYKIGSPMGGDWSLSQLQRIIKRVQDNFIL